MFIGEFQGSRSYRVFRHESNGSSPGQTHDFGAENCCKIQIDGDLKYCDDADPG
jgi:hypothetical protein